MGQPLDPASVASYVAAAKARTDDGQFAVTVAPTSCFFGASPNVPDTIAQLYRPSSPSSARLAQWRARYRYRVLSAWLVADLAHATQATGLLALIALDLMNYVDLRYPITSLAPFNPALGGKPQDPFAPPKMSWVATGAGTGFWSR